MPSSKRSRAPEFGLVDDDHRQRAQEYISSAKDLLKKNRKGNPCFMALNNMVDARVALAAAWTHAHSITDEAIRAHDIERVNKEIQKFSKMRQKFNAESCVSAKGYFVWDE